MISDLSEIALKSINSMQVVQSTISYLISIAVYKEYIMSFPKDF